ncbi:hypothetical protein ONZ45_g17571 [Pleurotus djamor]|nr:hypothetical protein ONZ45_g17571 [Pleurotus djamor]
MSTPSGKGAVHVTHQTRANVKSAILWDYEEAVITNRPLCDFVKASFGLTDAEIHSILEHNWQCPDGMDEYERLVGAHSYEPDRYPSFGTLMNDMTAQVARYYSDDVEAVQKGFHLVMYGTQRLSTGSSVRGPDGLVYWKELNAFSWATIKAFVELKVAQDNTKPDVRGCALPSKKRDFMSQLVGTSKSHSRHPKPRKVNSDLPTQKQKRALDLEEALPLPSSKRQRSEKAVTSHNVQMPLYALESLAAGSRRWTFGIFVDDFQMTLWYFDRIGAIHTQPFNFVSPENRGSLALLIAGMARCTYTQAGFDTLINAPRSPPLCREPFVPNPSYANAEIVIPKSIKSPSAEDMRYRIIGDDPLYGYRGTVGRGTTVYAVKALKGTKQDRDLVVKFSLPSMERPILEASMIRKLRTCEGLRKMRKHLPKIMQARVFSLRHMFYPRYSMNLAEMAREEARRLTVLVMPRYKHLWEVTSLEMFKKVFGDLVECHYYTHKVGNVLHRDLSENNLMWKFEDDDDDDEEEEYTYHPAECEEGEWDIPVSAETAESHKEATGSATAEEAAATHSPAADEGKEVDEDDYSKEFTDEAKLNYDIKSEIDAYNTAVPGKANHASDPEPQPEVETTDKATQPPHSAKAKQETEGEEPKVIGLLGDWDLASVLKGGVVPRSAAKHRTGTQPFMAVDLLDKNPPPHLYRHDLESFFYVLLWAMIHYDLKGKTKYHRRHALSPWESDMGPNAASKRDVLNTRNVREELFKSVQRKFKPLIDEWVEPLARMFRDGFNDREKHADLVSDHKRALKNKNSGPVEPPPKFDDETLGGKVTFENFMIVIGRTPTP